MLRSKKALHDIAFHYAKLVIDSLAGIILLELLLEARFIQRLENVSRAGSLVRSFSKSLASDTNELCLILDEG